MTKFALIAVAVLVAVSVGVMKPAEAQSAPTTTELQEQADLLDRLLLITYHTWVSRYNANRTNDDFEHFDWSQDHCSVPLDLRPPYRELFRMSCLRHDFMWRTLAVIDEGTGRMWNERNRYRADRQIESDTRAACLTEYPPINNPC